MRKERLLAVILSLSALLGTGGKALAEENPAEHPMIQEGRVWEYFKFDYKFNVESYDDRYYDACMLRYSFQGTETVNGKTYHRCILDEAVTWRSKKRPTDHHKPYDVEHHALGTCVGLLREEGQKVYMLLQSEFVNRTHYYCLQLKKDRVTEGQETLLFDFGAQYEEILPCYMTSCVYGPALTEASVWETRKVQDCAGQELTKVSLLNAPPPECLNTSEYWNNLVITEIDSHWVEGVGNTGPGEMLRFGGTDNYINDDTTIGNPSDDIIELYCGMFSYFNNLYDADGTVIYAGLNQQAPATNGNSSAISETP